MPEFLDEFLNITLPELWDKVLEIWDDFVDTVGGNSTYLLVIIIAIIICIILAIAVHRSNKREKKYYKDLEETASGDLIYAESDSISEELPTEEKPVEPIEVEPIEIETVEQVPEAKPIVMEKIELVRKETAHPGLTYDTNRYGKTFTEEELIETIKD